MFDVHNTEGETLSAPELIDRYIPNIRHVHLNEMDGRRPGTGLYDFAALFRTLERRHHYPGWCSRSKYSISNRPEKPLQRKLFLFSPPFQEENKL